MLSLNVVKALAAAAGVAGKVLSAAVVTAGAAYVAFQYSPSSSLVRRVSQAPLASVSRRLTSQVAVCM